MASREARRHPLSFRWWRPGASSSSTGWIQCHGHQIQRAGAKSGEQGRDPPSPIGSGGFPHGSGELRRRVDGLVRLIHEFFLLFIRFTEAGMETASVKPRLTMTMHPRRLGLPPQKIIYDRLG